MLLAGFGAVGRQIRQRIGVVRVMPQIHVNRGRHVLGFRVQLAGQLGVASKKEAILAMIVEPIPFQAR